MTTVKIEYYGVEASGRTVTEAKRAAGDRITAIVRNLAPRIFSYRGHTLVVYVSEGGANTTIIHPEDVGRHTGGTGLFNDLDDAVVGGIRHLLDITRHEGEYQIPDWVPHSIYRDYAKQWEYDWRSNDEFQARYRVAIGRGLNDHDAHSYACRNPARPELWVGVA